MEVRVWATANSRLSLSQILQKGGPFHSFPCSPVASYHLITLACQAPIFMV
nr:hypothetical protein Q903MT_gene1208 [Picea sitchensis]